MPASRTFQGAVPGAVLVAVVAGVLSLPPVVHAACDPAPRLPDCRQSTDSRDPIDIQATPFGTKDKIRWTIPHLESTSAADVPDPQTTDYAVCLYGLDGDDDFELRYQIVAPAGLGCGRARCWTQNAKGGVAYNGGATGPDGAATLRIQPGADGKARLAFVGRGPNLPLTEMLSIGPELVIEVQAGASCWSAYYVNFGQPPSIQTPARFRMKASTPF